MPSSASAASSPSHSSSIAPATVSRAMVSRVSVSRAVLSCSHSGDEGVSRADTLASTIILLHSASVYSLPAQTSPPSARRRAPCRPASHQRRALLWTSRAHQPAAMHSSGEESPPYHLTDDVEAGTAEPPRPGSSLRLSRSGSSSESERLGLGLGLPRVRRTSRRRTSVTLTLAGRP